MFNHESPSRSGTASVPPVVLDSTPEDLDVAAAKAGSVGMTQLLLEGRRPWRLEATIEAIHRGHLPVIQCLHRHDSSLLSDPILFTAALDCPSIVYWLRRAGCKWDPDILDLAFITGNIDVIDYLVRHGATASSDPYWIALGMGNAALLDWLAVHGYPTQISRYSNEDSAPTALDWLSGQDEVHSSIVGSPSL